jgi:hypothetical protein
MQPAQLHAHCMLPGHTLLIVLFVQNRSSYASHFFWFIPRRSVDSAKVLGKAGREPLALVTRQDTAPSHCFAPLSPLPTLPHARQWRREGSAHRRNPRPSTVILLFVTLRIQAEIVISCINRWSVFHNMAGPRAMASLACISYFLIKSRFGLRVLHAISGAHTHPGNSPASTCVALPNDSPQC